MVLRRATVLVLAGVFAACAGGQDNQAEEGMAEHATEMATPEQTLESIPANYAGHINANQPDMIAAMYTDSAVVLSADGTIAGGKDQILAWIQGQQAGSPSATITPAEQMVEGDLGIQHGTYQVTATPPGGTAVTQSGTFMTIFKKVGDEWKIDGLLTNFDAAPPEGFQWVKYEGEEPPENGTMKEFTDNWAKHFNLGHANMVADFYTDDAKVAYGGRPMVEGRAAIEAELTALIGDTKPQIKIHDVYSRPFGPDHTIDVGWFESSVGGKPYRTGEYMTLSQKQADGSYKAMWHISNGRPADM
jgi:ketosteroid isomerase-like protein